MIVRARLVCSEEGCAALYEASGSVAEIDSLGCDCGYGLQALGWPHPVEAGERVGRHTVLVPVVG